MPSVCQAHDNSLYHSVVLKAQSKASGRMWRGGALPHSSLLYLAGRALELYDPEAQGIPGTYSQKDGPQSQIKGN